MIFGEKKVTFGQGKGVDLSPWEGDGNSSLRNVAVTK